MKRSENPVIECRQCGTNHTDADNFCRRCGESLRVTRLPATRPAPLLPEKFRTSVKLFAWRGVATMAVTALAQVMLREAIRQVTPAPLRPPAKGGPRLPTRRSPGNSLAPAEWGGYPPAEIQEAIVVRRIKFRR